MIAEEEELMNDCRWWEEF